MGQVDELRSHELHDAVAGYARAGIDSQDAHRAPAEDWFMAEGVAAIILGESQAKFAIASSDMSQFA